MESNEEPAARRRLQRIADHAREILHHMRRHHKVVARAAIVSHVSYYSLVFIEAHGAYGIAGGICGIVILIEVILGQTHDEE